jgi:hypothetical protein
MSPTLSPLPSPLPGLATHSSGTRKTCNVLPFPSADPAPLPVPAATLPAWPGLESGLKTAFPTSWPAPLSSLPAAPDFNSGHDAPSEMPAFEFSTDPPATPQTAAALVPPSANFPPKETFSSEPDFTDDDLRQAFGPIMETAVRNAVYAKENGIDTYLEPMLRATIRRALAEYSPASRPFQAPGAFDRFIWHVQALFTSRTYEDIFFEKTRRFQVEEVFLLDASTLAMVSFASCDPARHSSARRISGTAQRLALQLKDEAGEVRPTFELSDHRRVISRKGRHVILMALVRGQPGELVYSDLEFALRRIEDHFREQFQEDGSSLLYALQPFLEDCPLIQAPASAA